MCESGVGNEVKARTGHRSRILIAKGVEIPTAISRVHVISEKPL